MFNTSAASYVMKTGGRLPGDKAARAWCWLLSV